MQWVNRAHSEFTAKPARNNEKTNFFTSLRQVRRGRRGNPRLWKLTVSRRCWEGRHAGAEARRRWRDAVGSLAPAVGLLPARPGCAAENRASPPASAPGFWLVRRAGRPQLQPESRAALPRERRTPLARRPPLRCYRRSRLQPRASGKRTRQRDFPARRPSRPRADGGMHRSEIRASPAIACRA